MSLLPRIRGQEAVTALHKAGFSTARVRGSHHVLTHLVGRRTVVPVHAGENLGPELLSQILRDAGLTPDEFRELL
ncbi:MAG: type II toxin-antitoxin system HicA family toxin [Candidatus Hydrogenedentes bacterium]|nr:type II toxin-antitoxin system HicA family toxin [Candidatus Hydrogenedentota bacterium]